MHRAVVLFAVAAFAAACGAAKAPAKPYVPRPGPDVSASCLSAARAGSLVRDSVGAVGGARVSAIASDTLYVRREGRALSDAEGRAVFEAFRPTGMAMASSALFSSAADCPDVARASCITMDLWLCQTSLEAFVSALDDALARGGAPDGALGVRLRILEPAGPTCKNASCPLDRHYGSMSTAPYAPGERRRPLGDGLGRCERDNDCEGAGNVCKAWYLRGGAELLLYVGRPNATFCGCIDNHCTWFDQP